MSGMHFAHQQIENACLCCGYLETFSERGADYALQQLQPTEVERILKHSQVKLQFIMLKFYSSTIKITCVKYTQIKVKSYS